MTEVEPLAPRHGRWPLGRTLASNPLFKAAIVSGLLIVLAISATLPQLLRAAPFSVFDEATHLDYAYRISLGEIPAAGDPLSEPILEAWACYDTEFFESPVVCGTQADPGEYNNRGEQYNSFHPPVYYFISGMLGRAIHATTDLDIVQSIRVTGTLWLAAGMVGLAFAGRSIGLRWTFATASAAVAGMWWPTLTASTHATNDAPFLLGAAAAIWVGGRIAKGDLGVMIPIAVSTAIASTKVMTGLAFLVIGGVAVLMALVPKLNPRRLPRARLAVVGVATAAPVAAVQLIWSRFQAGRGDPEYVPWITGINTEPVVGLPIGEWIDTLLLGFSSFGHVTVHPSVASVDLILVACQVVAVVALIAPFLGLAVARRGNGVAYLALATLAGFAVWPLIVQVQAHVTNDIAQYFPAPNGRYGVVLVPMAMAVAAGVAQQLRWTAVTLLIAAGIVAATLIAVWRPDLQL